MDKRRNILLPSFMQFFFKILMCEQSVHPAVAGITQHQQGNRRLGIVSVKHRARGVIKVPHRAAVQERVPPVLNKVETPSFRVPFDKEFLQEKHVLPGGEIQIFIKTLVCLRIYAVFAVDRSFRSKHVVLQVIDFTDGGPGRRHDPESSVHCREPAVGSTVFFILLQQVASGVVGGFTLPGICPFFESFPFFMEGDPFGKL